MQKKREEAMDRNQRLFGPRSQYDWSFFPTERLITIVDTGHTFTRSVTNDADNVVRDLAAKGIPVDQCAILYRDAEAVWDRIHTMNGRFIGFSFVGERELKKATEKTLGHASPQTGI
jgi:hypothetical protein